MVTIKNCPAIDHGVTIFPDGKIRPCCQIAADYSRPATEINNPDRFADLRDVTNPHACKSCIQKETAGIRSYRQLFESKHNKSIAGLQFVDFRHSNQCNLKCRYCGPHFSNQWARELGHEKTLRSTDIEQYYSTLLTSDLVDLYWTGGEPLIIKEHYDVLTYLIEHQFSDRISLRYNTNLTVTQYKDIDLSSLWKKFKSVDVQISIDAAGPELNYIRSGSDWLEIDTNINQLLTLRSQCPTLTVSFSPTVSLLNVWFLPRLYEYARNKNVPVNMILLQGPDYLSLTALYHPELKILAQQQVEQIKPFITTGHYNELLHMIDTGKDQYLFDHAVRHILLLDNLRKEKLFDILPFKKLALDTTARNYEYE